MIESERINARALVTPAKFHRPKLLAALLFLVFVSVVIISLAATGSNPHQPSVRHSIELVGHATNPAALNTVKIAPQTKMSMLDLCQALGPGNPTYPCYSEPSISSTNFLYGFHTGAGHGKQAGKAYSVTINRTRYFLTLDSGQQYSVDRCALAHDSFYWSRETQDSKVNDYNFYKCIERVRPKANETIELTAKTMVLRGGIVSISRVFEKPLGGWRELPIDAADIPADRNSSPPDISGELKLPKPAAVTGNASCGLKYPRSFLDPRKGGQCWQCPAGYNRAGVSFVKGMPDVTSKTACVKGEVAGFGGTFTSAKHVGKPGCPKGSFEHGLTTNCFSCPSGYRRNPNLSLSLKIDLRIVKDACIAN